MGQENTRMQLLKLGADDAVPGACRNRTSFQIRLAEVKRGSFEELLLQAAIPFSVQEWSIGIVLLSTFVSYSLYVTAGPIVGLMLGPVLVYHFFWTYPLALAQRRRREALSELSVFIDGVLVSTKKGFTLAESFEASAAKLKSGVIKEAFGKTSEKKTSADLLTSLENLAHLIRGQEIMLFVLAVQLAIESDSRFAAVLYQEGIRLREQMQAFDRSCRELNGAKQIFYVALTCVLVSTLVIFIQTPALFMQAFQHPSIKYVVQGAVVAQVICMMLLKSITGAAHER